MDTFFGGLGAPMMLLAGAFVGITALLWFLLPFSVFGIKARLDQEIDLLARIEQQLKSLNRAVNNMTLLRPESGGKSDTPFTTQAGEPPEEPLVPPGREDDSFTAQPSEDRWQRPE
jgi:hypothetical protein